MEWLWACVTLSRGIYCGWNVRVSDLPLVTVLKLQLGLFLLRITGMLRHPLMGSPGPTDNDLMMLITSYCMYYLTATVDLYMVCMCASYGCWVLQYLEVPWRRRWYEACVVWILAITNGVQDDASTQSSLSTIWHHNWLISVVSLAPQN